MIRSCFLVFSLVLTTFSGSAQVGIPVPAPLPPVRLPPAIALQQLRAYLGLTDTQASQLLQNLDDYGRLVSLRQQRMFQVQSEIRDETAKSPLDPAALGIRYAEIETICRNVRDESAATQTRNLTMLTDAQKVKLKALDDAYKLMPVINEAQNVGLLSPPGPYGNIISGVLSGTSFLLGYPTPSLPGCQQQQVFIPANRVATGDFTFAP
jgi:hypothetical protein